jgi:hypothetical protein
VATTADAFVRVATALAAAWRRDATLFDTAPPRVVNALLDDCGSDYRPLVALLLSVDATFRARCLTGGRDEPWELRRAPLVHHLAATRYLQPDVARWVVDAWGAALGVAPPVVEAPRLDTSHDTPLDTPHRTMVTALAGAGPSAHRSATTAIPHGAKPAVASAAGRIKVGAPVTPVALTTHHPAPPPLSPKARPVARWRATGGGVSAQQIAEAQRIERRWFVTMGAVFLLLYIIAAFGIAERKSHPVRATALLPTVPRERPAPSGDTILPLPAPDLQAAPAATTVALGLQGTYRVRQAIRQVSGSRSCTSVATRLASGRTTLERIAHRPGARHFLLATRQVNGTVDTNGVFAIAATEGTTNGVQWLFSMDGRFTPTGFVAETHTTTWATLAWRRMQRCYTVADLTAERLSP